MNRTQGQNRGLFQPYRFFREPGGEEVYDCPREVSLLIVSVTTGELDVFIGDARGGDANSIPALHFGKTNAPVPVPLTRDRHSFTFRAGGADTCRACILFCEHP